jgi:hypothetical protein
MGAVERVVDAAGQDAEQVRNRVLASIRGSMHGSKYAIRSLLGNDPPSPVDRWTFRIFTL